MLGPPFWEARREDKRGSQMPDRKKLTESITEAGKQALASDAGQAVLATIAE
jgi:hypothetical protein